MSSSPFSAALSARELRRQQQRVQQRAATRPSSHNRNRRINSTGGLLAISRCSEYTPEQAASLGNEVRLSWYKLCNGGADLADFDNLAMALNVTCMMAEPLGQVAVDVAVQAQHAALGMRTRYERIGRLGPDATALANIPPALDLYDQFLSVSTPRQLTTALQTSLQRMKSGNVLQAAEP